MYTTKTFTTCPKCNKEINISNGWNSYNKHLSRHNNPNSPLCNRWYKGYFDRVSANTLNCKLCDEEIYHNVNDPFSNHQYQDHLAKHRISDHKEH